jgi:hypothetical protein
MKSNRIQRNLAEPNRILNLQIDLFRYIF